MWFKDTWHIYDDVKYQDNSTTEALEFTSHCQLCDRVIETYTSRAGPFLFRPNIFMTASERRAKELLWLQGHDKALREFLAEEQEVMYCCCRCGAFICEDCHVTLENDMVVCKDCAEVLEEHML